MVLRECAGWVLREGGGGGGSGAHELEGKQWWFSTPALLISTTALHLSTSPLNTTALPLAQLPPSPPALRFGPRR